jgi:hypothetical protein
MISRLVLAVSVVLCALSLAWMAAAENISSSSGGGNPFGFTPAQVVNVVDYGAKCNASNVDDSVGINAAIAAAAAFTTGNEGMLAVQVTGPFNSYCVISNSINATNILIRGFTIALPHIECGTNGKPCIDALASGVMNFVKLNIWGSCTGNTPNNGIQFGRISSTNADNLYFERPYIHGCFTQSPWLNLASETLTVIDAQFLNWQSTGTYYAAIQDGCNHFNTTSQFVTQTIGIDSCQSFNENLFIGGSFGTRGSGGIPLFLVNTTRHSFKRSYTCVACNVGTPGVAAVIHTVNNGIAAHFQLELDMHWESSPPANIVFSGNTAAPVMKGLRYQEHLEQAANSIFSLDTAGTYGTAITGMTIQDLEVEIAATVSNAATPLFDNAALYTVNGKVQLPLQGEWSEPAAMSGQVCIALNCTHYVPTPPINRNPDFVLDQPNEGAAFLPGGANFPIVDGWRNNNSGIGGITYQRLAGSSCPGYQYQMQLSVSTQAAPTATQYNIFETIIEGSDAAMLNWGTGYAASVQQPLSIDFCAYATNAGTYPAFVTNTNVANRSYVLTYTIAANTWTRFHFVVPPETTGNWLFTKNTPSVYVGFTTAAGSNFQTTAGAWQTGQYYGTSATTNLTNVSGGSLFIAAVHVYPGYYRMPYQPRNIGAEINLAKRYYHKSFASSVKPGQNAGTVGAVTFSAPYAFATKSTVEFYVPYPTQMYINNNNPTNAPTPTFYSTSAASANCYDSTQGADAGAAAAINKGDSGFTLQCTMVVGDLIGDQVQVHYSVDTGF